MAMTLTQLGSFLAVVRTGSITAAAEQLRVTQPSVSAALQALSRELGVEVTEPAGRSVRPSPAGRAFAPYVASVLGLLEEGARAARAVAAGPRAAVRIACETAAGESLVPGLVGAFAREHPDLAVHLEVVGRDEVLRRVLDRTADVGVTSRPAAELPLTAAPLLAEPLVVVADRGHPLAAAPVVTPEQLARQRWLVREPGSEQRETCLRFLGDLDPFPELATLGSGEALKQAVRAGLGVALVPRGGVELELGLQVLKALPVERDLPELAWCAVRARGGPESEPADRFVAWARTRASAPPGGAVPALAAVPAE